jgi:hypothetical protein
MSSQPKPSKSKGKGAAQQCFRRFSRGAWHGERFADNPITNKQERDELATFRKSSGIRNGKTIG